MRSCFPSSRWQKHFGGLKAVDGVGHGGPAGARSRALIGPNGSGKTTILNTLSGLYVPTAGEIILDGKNISGEKAALSITSLGIARTFQKHPPFRGADRSGKTCLIGQPLPIQNRPRFQLFSSRPSQRAEEARMREKALELLKICRPSEARSFSKSSSLPLWPAANARTGACPGPSDPKLLMLDEPAAGFKCR